jgi:hypothetical protein
MTAINWHQANDSLLKIFLFLAQPNRLASMMDRLPNLL